MWREPAIRLKSIAHTFLKRKRRVEEIACFAAGCVILLRFTGWLQPVEWSTFDRLFRLRGVDEPDERIVIVEIDEQDLNQLGEWPISDRVMADLLQRIDQAEPRAIGLDIYRDLSVKQGQAELNQFFRQSDRIIGIEMLPDRNNNSLVNPPPILAEKGQVGFNNVMVDADGIVRRNLLYWTNNDEFKTSFALQLAFLYLQAEGIEPRPGDRNPQNLQLGDYEFQIFQANDGAYVEANTGGYQVLANYRGPGTIESVSISEVLADQVPDETFRDRIVIIGSTAVSLKDFVRTPFNSDNAAQPLTAGAEIQADFTSQIISAALAGRPMIQVWPQWASWLWILGSAYGGALLAWHVRSPWKMGLGLGILSISIGGVCIIGFMAGPLWIPLVPPLLALIGSSSATTIYWIQQAEKLKKSKEFLSSVINTIPDPIFVTDTQHRWIALNQAYCNFIGYPLETLLENTAADFLPASEAETFLDNAQYVFQTQQARETEEDFTNAQGNKFSIATKRSLHQDSSGNLFLVGVIRDITDRKRLENQLRRTATELMRSNTELRKAEGRLRHMAYHDALTGLPNREFFYDRFHESMVWADEHQRMVGLLFLDLDGFKQINDNLGHDIGDQLLQAVAGRLTGCLRGSDVVSRLGGDEFTVLLPGIPDSEAAARVAEKILTKLAQPFGLENQRVSITASLGISLYPIHGRDIEELMKLADSKMYQAKRVGKNRFEIEAESESSINS